MDNFDRDGTTVGAAPCWQTVLRRAVRDPAELCRKLGLPPHIVDRHAAAGFSVFVPEPYLRRIRPGDPSDPMLRQVLPLAEETRPVAGFSPDPVGDLNALLSPGLLKKYEGRALLVTTGACAVHCRYCFRRHFPYSSGPRSLDAWQPAIDRIGADRSIEEVLLSGGDPLTLVDETLISLIQSLDRIEQLQRLRIHTRLPIVIPQRVTRELVDCLSRLRATPIVVIHANHPRELDHEVEQALQPFSRSGVMLLNQAVLLRGVNDDAEVLIDLSRRLIELRVVPYYLHQLDRVAGAAHFEVPVERGRQLMAVLRAALPGYAVPQYVQEREGERHKTLLA